MENNKFEFEGISGVEIMHYTILFCGNWREDDFRIAFKKSRLGNGYFWERLQDKIMISGIDPSAAAMEIILNMDTPHQQMLFDYLFNKKYLESLLRSRDMQLKIDDVSNSKSLNPKKEDGNDKQEDQ